MLYTTCLQQYRSGREFIAWVAGEVAATFDHGITDIDQRLEGL